MDPDDYEAATDNFSPENRLCSRCVEVDTKDFYQKQYLLRETSLLIFSGIRVFLRRLSVLKVQCHRIYR